MAEDAAMETCPSPEMGDSRKRPLDSDPENEQTKRSHFSSGKFCKSNPKKIISKYQKKKDVHNEQKAYFYRFYILSLISCSILPPQTICLSIYLSIYLTINLIKLLTASL